VYPGPIHIPDTAIIPLTWQVAADMVAVIVLAALLAILVCAFVAFYFHSRTPEWGDSELRRSVLRMLVVIGPLWGMHYQEPRPELPVVTTPGPEKAPLPMRDTTEEH
jgi:hypothetical protein